MQFRPEAPNALNLVASLTSIDITIDEDFFTGSAPLERVDIRYRTAGDEQWTIVQDFGTSGQINGLAPDEIYFVQARFVNEFGEGPWSANQLEKRSESLVSALMEDGLISQSDIDAIGTLEQYVKSSSYREVVRDLLQGETSYRGFVDDYVSATVVTGSATPQPDPIVMPAPVESAPVERLDFESLAIEDFLTRTGRHDLGEHSVSDDGAALMLDSQAWQSVLMDVEVTADTWLSFDFSAAVEGDIHGIMFTDREAVSQDTAFNLFGTQTGWGIEDYNYTGAGAVQRIEIPVGAHFTGSFDRLVFLTDDDDWRGANSVFENVTLSTGGESADVFLVGAMLSSWKDLDGG
jgi:hypothetical protein